MIIIPHFHPLIVTIIHPNLRMNKKLKIITIIAITIKT